METQEQISEFRKIIEDSYYHTLIEAVRKGDRHFVFDFNEIAKLNVDLAEDLLEDTEEVLKAAGISISQFDLNLGKTEEIIVRIKNLPKTQKTRIRDLRSKHLNKFLCIEGTIRQKSDIRPQVITSRFECPSCGNIIPVLQLDQKFKEPSRCGCGRKGKFKMLSKELIDAQHITLEEDIETLDGGEQPKKLKIFLKNDLITPLSERKACPGTKIRVNGFLKEIPIILKGGGQSTTFDWMLDCNYFEPINEDFGELKISEEEKATIKELAKDPKIIQKLVKSLVPSIHGHEQIKEALLIQLAGGVKKETEDSRKLRADTHILLIGDPGAGKTELLKRINTIAPKSRFISGKGASGPGLTASVVKDEFMGGWALEAGAIVLANKGLICLDELDKMSKEDTSSMHEALEGQTVTISKANIQATLRCETTVLAAANPKFGRFEPNGEPIAKQIQLPSTLINRFDLIFPIMDIPDEKKDEKLGDFMFDVHMKANGTKSKNEGEKASNNQDLINTDLLRKYIAYTKQTKPLLTEEAKREGVKYFKKIRNSSKQSNGSNSPIPISPRQLQAIIRMAEAYAKIRLSDYVERSDMKNSITMLDDCLRKIAFDEETGKIDIDRIGSGTSTSERNRFSTIRTIISNLEEEFGKHIPIEKIQNEAANKNIVEEKFDESINKLKRSGDISEVRRGFISRI